jgi:hypothetical protein
MRYRCLEYSGKRIYNQNKIEQILEENNLSWLIDSEFEDADIEIKNRTLIWNSGNYYSGIWYYGIWKSGTFYGTWMNGIFEGGIFKGKFISGIKSV